MLRPLKNKSKKLILLKIKLKNFLKDDLWQYVIVLGSVALCAFLFNRWIEAIMFCISHTAIRSAFDKQFHFVSRAKTGHCLMLTLLIVWFSTPITPPITESILASIPVAFAICYVGYFVQDKIDIKLKNDDLEREITSLINEIQKYKNIDLYKLSEEELRQYGASQQLSEIQQDILCMRVLEHLKISEICKYHNYGRTTIKYHLGQIKQKLGITTL